MEVEIFSKTEKRCIQLPEAMTFDGDVAQKWSRFILKFQLFLLDSGNDSATDHTKVSLLLSSIGAEGHAIYDSFNLSESEKWEYSLVLNEFSQHCASKLNLTHARYTFFKQLQAEEQSFDSFVKNLHTKSEHCEFGSLKDSLVKDMIVLGVRDPKLRAKLLTIGDLNLTTACHIGRTHKSEARQAEYEVSTDVITAQLPAGTSCYLCSFTGDSVDRVKKHFEQMHVERAIQVMNCQCLHCGCSEHEEMHYHCPLCDVMSTDEQLLSRHALAEHDGIYVVAATSGSCSESGAQSDSTSAQMLPEAPSSPTESGCNASLEESDYYAEPVVKLMRLDPSSTKGSTRRLQQEQRSVSFCQQTIVRHGEMSTVKTSTDQRSTDSWSTKKFEHPSVIRVGNSLDCLLKTLNGYNCELCHKRKPHNRWKTERHIQEKHGNHVLLHKDVQMFMCCQSCHTAAHYHCCYCGKAWKQQSVLLRHIKDQH